MRIKIVPAALGKWYGELTIDGEVVHSIRGPRPGCVARDLLNWLHLNIMSPSQLVELEITTYE
jgi:hypothetical protein